MIPVSQALLQAHLLLCRMMWLFSPWLLSQTQYTQAYGRDVTPKQSAVMQHRYMFPSTARSAATTAYKKHRQAPFNWTVWRSLCGLRWCGWRREVLLGLKQKRWGAHNRVCFRSIAPVRRSASAHWLLTLCGCSISLCLPTALPGPTPADFKRCNEIFWTIYCWAKMLLNFTRYVHNSPPNLI